MRLAKPCTPGEMVNAERSASVPGGLPLAVGGGAGEETTADLSKDDPHVRRQPDPYPQYWLLHFTKIFHVPGETLMLNEWNAEFRQIYTDGGRCQDPTRFTAGLIENGGDTFVITTKGFRKASGWIRPESVPDATTMTERITRPNFGTLNLQITIDDPKAYTKPFTIDMNMKIAIDTQMIEEFCLENRDAAKLSAPLEASRNQVDVAVASLAGLLLTAVPVPVVAHHSFAANTTRPS